MSKYIYTTIYEQFTGLKPPEPKNQKPRRRRGYGHPYRMRLNMQDDDQPQEEMLNDDFQVQVQVEIEPPVAPKPFLTPSVSTSPVRNRTPSPSIRPRRTGNTPIPGSTHTRAPMPEEFIPKNAEPKVTYKKRRHYSQPVMSSVPLGGDRKDPQDY